MAKPPPSWEEATAPCSPGQVTAFCSPCPVLPAPLPSVILQLWPGPGCSPYSPSTLCLLLKAASLENKPGHSRQPSGTSPECKSQVAQLALLCLACSALGGFCAQGQVPTLCWTNSDSFLSCLFGLKDPQHPGLNRVLWFLAGRNVNNKEISCILITWRRLF